MKRNGIIILATVLLFQVFFLIKLYAQKTPTGLSVTPSNFEFTIIPGEQVIKTITLDNLTSKPVDIQVLTRNFTAQGEEGNVTLTGEDIPYSLASWITVSPENTTIDTKKRGVFTFTINAPKNAEPGGHFGSIVFSTAPRKDITETGAVVSQEIGALILVKIPGDVNEKALLESFASQKAFYMSGPAKFDIRVKNESTVHLKPEGTIIIKDMFGKKDASYVESRNILPDATRKLLSTWNKKFLIGKYTANLTLFYGESNQVIYSSTDFYAFPVKEGAIILGVLIILFFLRKRLFRAIKALITGR